MDPVIKMKAQCVIGYQNGRHVVYEDGEVVYRGDQILFVGHNYLGDVDETWDCGKAIISPGFIDLNCDIDTDHANFDVVRKEKCPPDPARVFVPGPEHRTVDCYSDKDFYIRQKYSFAQCLMNGITTAMPICGETFHGWGQSYHEFEIMAGTAAEMGIRAYLGPSFRSLYEHPGPLDEKRERQSVDDAYRYCENFDNTNNGLIRAFLNPCELMVLRPEIFREVRDYSIAHNIPTRIHFCEDSREWPELMIPQYGDTTINVLDGWGLLWPQLILPHAVYATDGELRKLAANGVTVCQTHIAEVNVGWAISFAKYQSLGLNMTIGTDAQPVDMIQNMRLAWDLDRLHQWRVFFTRFEEGGITRDLLADEPRYPVTGAIDYFNAATINAAKALGREDLGRLAPGARADIIVVDLNSLRIGPTDDYLRTLLVSCVGNNIRHTIVGGKVRMKDWKLVGVDEDQLMVDAQETYEHFLSFYEKRDLYHRRAVDFFPPSMPIIRPPHRS